MLVSRFLSGANMGVQVDCVATLPSSHQIESTANNPFLGAKALVVEGGAMRGIFSAGVLDSFLQFGFSPYNVCLGVSAGSTNLAAWLAGQQGRNYRVITDYSCRPEFISLTNYLRGKHYIDLDWLWQITINEIRLDLNTFSKQTVPLYVVTTDIQTGEANYVLANAGNLEQLLKASCAVPLAYRSFPELDGKGKTDGGVADSIPVIKAYEMGARDITVVLSKAVGFRKKPSSMPWLIDRLFAQYPALQSQLKSRYQRYNQALEFIQNPPADCRIRIIAPPSEFSVGRTTRDDRKLRAGYSMGRKAGSDFIHQFSV